MIRLLYKLFRKQFNRLAFHEQGKPVGFDKLSFQFYDSTGKAYYSFNDMLDNPIERQWELIKLNQEYTAGITNEEFQREIETMEKALNKGQSPDLAWIGHIISEWKWRRDNVLHFNVILEICAVFYIAEDEDPARFDHEKHNRKVEQFKKDYQSGLRVFFCNADLMKLLGLKDISPEKRDRYIQNSKARIEASKEIVKNYLSGKELSNQSSDSKKSS